MALCGVCPWLSFLETVQLLQSCWLEKSRAGHDIVSRWWDRSQRFRSLSLLIKLVEWRSGMNVRAEAFCCWMRDKVFRQHTLRIECTMTAMRNSVRGD